MTDTIRGLKIEELSPMILRSFYSDAVFCMRESPGYESFFNSEEKRLITIVLGTDWVKLVHTLPKPELENRFYLAFPDCPDGREMGIKLF